MEACEEVADTFSDRGGCTDFFSSRLGSLNLSFTSLSFDPAFTFDTSSRSSSLRHCESTSRTAASEILAPAPPLLAAVSATPCASSRRHVAVMRRTSTATGQPEALARLSTSSWSSGLPAVTGALATIETSATTSASCAGAVGCPAAALAGVKRRSCPEATGSQLSQQQQQGKGDEVGTSSEVLQPVAPHSPTASFASFAAALAAHYFADFGSVPDVPTHIEEVRLRGGKRQRVLAVERIADL